MKVADYLLDRLAERGIRHVFGVPGDYNLALLNEVLAHDGLQWVGNTNELNAAYAADGYARVHGLSAVAFTYGVGELSGINGVAGACAENVPIVVIVSVPSRAQCAAHAVMHHGLPDGQWDHFARMYHEVTAAQAVLSPENAASEIDRVLAAAERERRPVYIAIPSDVATAALPEGHAPAPEPRGDDGSAVAEFTDAGSAVAEFAAAVAALAADSARAVLLLGHEAARFGLAARVQRLAVSTGIPVAITPMGKGTVDEDAVVWLGLYDGGASEPAVREAVEKAPLLIRIGTPLSDTETAGFTARFDESRVVDVRPDHGTVAGRRFAPLPFDQALDALGEVLAGIGWDSTVPPAAPTASAQGAGGRLTQAALWPRVASALRPGDVVVVGSGTAAWGMLSQHLPSGVTYLAQTHWGSIGGALPAALGASLAAPGRRVVLIIGDGSLQLTVQELATVARWRLPVTVMLINNHGYTIERIIDGATAVYNDIPLWNHRAVVRAITAVDDLPVTEIRTTAELDNALEEFNRSAPALRVYEFHTDLMDVPQRLQSFVSTLAAAR
ncbi:thiamine pyrophosphate-binding protein [Nocardia sp. CDC159]|uniref:Alpha-keto-acid decarboxylase n=1 Tax=Nocardia pulmonis TaxID=2951408 RepID=A0A9X2J2V7_9NOCA|nr:MULTISPECIES: thiamine pyrophosphate-binding protein [Nocardia]MCM6778436.1 thiamine pyrophosphate-binding protein [Nocardia pulmonis]MCM6791325.1 thiamine pyrophosphate-binding protein [Nocardia sp. CDC159]